MNRKELACAAVGAVLGATGCSAPVKQLLVPDAMADAKLRPAAGQPYIIKVKSWMNAGAALQLYLDPAEAQWKISSSNEKVAQWDGSNGKWLIIYAVGVGDAIVTVAPPGGGPATQFELIVRG